MPYVDEWDRDYLQYNVTRPNSPGQLNYLLTSIIWAYIGRERSYAKYNEVLGVLTCMIQEIYRRLVAPYEDEKIEENGDVFIERSLP